MMTRVASCSTGTIGPVGAVASDSDRGMVTETESTASLAAMQVAMPMPMAIRVSPVQRAVIAPSSSSSLPSVPFLPPSSYLSTVPLPRVAHAPPTSSERQERPERPATPASSSWSFSWSRDETYDAPSTFDTSLQHVLLLSSNESAEGPSASSHACITTSPSLSSSTCSSATTSLSCSATLLASPTTTTVSPTSSLSESDPDLAISLSSSSPPSPSLCFSRSAASASLPPLPPLPPPTPALPSALSSYTVFLTFFISLLVCVTAGNIVAFSTWSLDLKSTFSWSQSDTDLLGSLGNASGYFAPVLGVFIARYPPSYSAFASFLLCAGGYLIMALAVCSSVRVSAFESPAVLGLCYMGISVGCSTMYSLVLNVTAKVMSPKRFVRVSLLGLSMALLACLYGFSSSVYTLAYNLLFSDNLFSYLLFTSISTGFINLLAAVSLPNSSTTAARTTALSSASSPSSSSSSSSVPSTMTSTRSLVASPSDDALGASSSSLQSSLSSPSSLTSPSSLNASSSTLLDVELVRLAELDHQDELDAQRIPTLVSLAPAVLTYRSAHVLARTHEAASGRVSTADDDMSSPLSRRAAVATDGGDDASASSPPSVACLSRFSARLLLAYDTLVLPLERWLAGHSNILSRSFGILIEMLRVPAFHYLFWHMFMVSGCGLFQFNNTSDLIQSLNGGTLDRDLLLQMVIVQSACNAGARLAMSLSDAMRIRRGAFLVLSSVCVLVGQVLNYVLVDSPRSIYVGLIPTSIGYGALWGIGPTIIAQSFGRETLAITFGWICISFSVSSLVFNLFSGHVYDEHTTVGPDGTSAVCIGRECFRDAFLFSAVSGALAVVLSIAMYPYTLRGKLGGRVNECLRAREKQVQERMQQSNEQEMRVRSSKEKTSKKKKKKAMMMSREKRKEEESRRGLVEQLSTPLLE